MADDFSERGAAGSAEPLEARELWLDRDRRVARRVDDSAAVSADRCRGAVGGIAGRVCCGQRLRPEPTRIRVEAKDYLRASGRDEVDQPVAEVRAGWTLLL
jgi:hypothetical protein